MKSIYLAALCAVVLFFSCNQSSHSPADISAIKQKAVNSYAPERADDKDLKLDRLATASSFFSDSTGTPQQEPPQVDNKKQQQQSPTTQPTPKPAWDKKIVKTAALNIEVKSYKDFSSSLHEKVKSFGGYIAQEEQNQSDYKIENTLTIKVPVDQFDNAVIQLSGNTEKINEKKITSEDVTTEMVDTRSRLESKKQVRLRYLDLLKQAKNMEEILSVQSEINTIQEEIEAAAGRIEYLGHASTFSTINLTYYQVLNPTAKDTDAPPSFGTKLGNAFHVGWSWIGELFVGMVSIWPLFLLGFFVYALYRKNRARVKTAGVHVNKE